MTMTQQTEKPKPADIAKRFVQSCRSNQVEIEIRGSEILTLSKRIIAGDGNSFADAETDCSIIYNLPGGCGSVWGTDGGSIGGMVAMQTGQFKLNRSGIQKRILKAIREAMRQL
jgi:hypothetical protein